jgi:hypothetical protein
VRNNNTQADLDYYDTSIDSSIPYFVAGFSIDLFDRLALHFLHEKAMPVKIL